MNNECQGCKSFLNEGNDHYCDAEVTNTVGQYKCPCINCIVKMVCENTCKDFKRYANMYIKEVA